MADLLQRECPSHEVLVALIPAALTISMLHQLPADLPRWFHHPLHDGPVGYRNGMIVAAAGLAATN
jgi:hypothetical protein